MNFQMVRIAGFEPALSWSRTKHFTKLSYILSSSVCLVMLTFIQKRFKPKNLPNSASKREFQGEFCRGDPVLQTARRSRKKAEGVSDAIL